jgi:hypothetical protein
MLFQPAIVIWPAFLAQRAPNEHVDAHSVQWPTQARTSLLCRHANERLACCSSLTTTPVIQTCKVSTDRLIFYIGLKTGSARCTKQSPQIEGVLSISCNRDSASSSRARYIPVCWSAALWHRRLLVIF